MNSLTWTHIQTSLPKPPRLIECSLIAVTESKLVLHGGTGPEHRAVHNTWVLDLPQMAWSQHTSKEDHPRTCHQSCVGLNADVIILGGNNDGDEDEDDDESFNMIFHVMLEPKSLQQQAMKIVHKHRNVLPWKQCLPPKLTAAIDVPEDAGNASDVSSIKIERHEE